MVTLTIISFSFSIKGLVIIYNNGENNVLTLCPLATCDILKDCRFIEDFTIDKNGEPVILYSDIKEPREYGFCYWCQFVRTFFFSQRVAEMILEYKASFSTYESNMKRINRLLNPSKAA